MPRTPTKAVAAIAATLLVTVLVSACGSDAGMPAATGTSASPTKTTAAGTAVEVKNFLFKPEEVTVKVGESVTWTNQDQILHTATAGTPEKPSKAFDGQMPEQGATFEHRFDEPGSYRYFCSRHEHMRGTVIVE